MGEGKRGKEKEKEKEKVDFGKNWLWDGKM